MIRYTFRYESGSSAGCHFCGNVAVGIQTDRVTGEERWACKKHIKIGGFSRRTQLHPDFQKQTKSRSFLHVKKSEKAIVAGGSA